MNQFNDDKILEKVRELFKQTMGDDIEIDMNTEKDMIGEWDSINHLNLIIELESAFGLGLSMDEIEALSSVRQIVEKIHSKKA